MKEFPVNRLLATGHNLDSLADLAGRILNSGRQTLCDTRTGSDSSTSLERNTIGILYADVADYARLTEHDEEGTHLRLVECMKTIARQVARHEGRIASLAGDAVLAEFTNADHALQCAIDIQTKLQRWNARINPQQRVCFRIGINYGEVISDRGNIFGKAVNLAARLAELACSGGICVSEQVLATIRNRPPKKFVALGQQYVKNIRTPVRAFWFDIDTFLYVDPEEDPETAYPEVKAS